MFRVTIPRGENETDVFTVSAAAIRAASGNSDNHVGCRELAACRECPWR